ncbi:hypothetical protein BCR41DRAFT_357393 [Lobosporangium transversale]|uniref:Ubiquitin-like protease family profile domain-containing protein n=1 Tax=Lobosporangium transversale TaxID=64571 RepID=A0A1Y2GHM9_9FUNG|nr:hypothetical protein BCR41DRAFT_357393 [Lobosporangium transversale]ORZ11035.1 hypothetical protein BCR41DRAFT_357393 [Lobosporangium transversale]|eukprot:XP_021879552.1 hypothetical protein BCR41DRAFT_357393 [Lobosporangium transversale]
MTSSKRKSIVDTAELSKRARLWFTEGLDGISSYLGLKPLESLVIEQQRKKHDWRYEGAYVRGVLLKEGQDQHFPAHRRPSPSSLSPNDGSKKPAEPTAAAMDNSEENKPYQLEPYTKLPTFTAPDFRERPSFADESNSSLASGSPSSSSVSSVTGSSRFSNLPHHIDLNKTPYCGLDHESMPAKLKGQLRCCRARMNRLQAALDATIGALRSDRESIVSSRRTSQPSIDEEIAEHRRMREYYRSYDKDDLLLERSITSRQPAWLRTGYQGNKEPTWLKNIRNLINRNLPSVEKQERPPSHQAIVSEHERIEKELKARKSGHEHFPPLAKDDEQRVAEALADGYDIQTLRPGQWLNDEVINFYGNLIMARSKESTELPKVHVFSTFFYKTLSENGYEKVRRWTKKKPFDFHGWENDCPKDIPTQKNGFDCGVFTCTFIEFKSRGQDQLDFSQRNMDYLRKKIALSIINKSL